ncbi:MAG: YlbF family regulator [Firmicutes bacterium]|nr:YlbF family regulator [Bacillota bacterium]
MVEKKTVTGHLNHHQLILHQAGKLADMLKQSPEYNQYLAAREKLEADEVNSNILAELRQQEMAMQMTSMFEENEDALREMERSFAQMSQVPVINDYLFAEGRLLRLISDVEGVFAERLGLAGEDEEPLPRSGNGQWLH